MHELSLVQSVFAALKDELPPEEMAKVAAVELKIGLLANVEPILLQNAFTAYQQTHPEYAAIELKTLMVDIMIHCPNCHKQSKVSNYVFRCAYCDTPSNQIVAGEELLIHKIYYHEKIP
ncbi:MAG: hydrogenase maturation nickel metallochaperone HypA [Bacteroidota bacterium]